ncbi:MAG: class I SAM-dependent methyltransferase [bacterium]
MKSDYWDALAPSFQEEVFDPVASDLQGIILSEIRRVASKDATALDLGCGVGRSLPALSGLFGQVVAVDHSARCLEIARRSHEDLGNIRFLQRDLTERGRELEPADVALCINVALIPDYRKRLHLFENVARSVRAGGHMLLVVPALESFLLSMHRLTLWNLEDHDSYKSAAVSASEEYRFTARSIRDGVVHAGEVPTKHYTREELEILLETMGHRIVSIDKAEYGWDTEFEDPPESMGAPYPWDWFAVSRPRRGKRSA